MKQKLRSYSRRYGVFLMIAVGLLAFWQYVSLQRAHSSFESYASFRGCQRIIEKSATSGKCLTTGGEVVTIVLYQGKWYLDGDLPCGFLCF